jgi:hypothetical protein
MPSLMIKSSNPEFAHESHTGTLYRMSIDRKSTTPWSIPKVSGLKAEFIRDSGPKRVVDTVTQNHVKCLCELCANISESPVQNSSDQSTLRPKISNESRRFKPFTKTLDHGIGVRIPASSHLHPFATMSRFLHRLASVASVRTLSSRGTATGAMPKGGASPREPQVGADARCDESKPHSERRPKGQVKTLGEC